VTQEVQTYFDGRAKAGTWGALYEPAPEGLHYFNYNFYTRRNAVMDLIGSEPAERILDVGCGTGDYAPLARLAPYCGIDFAPEMVHQAHRRFGETGGRVGFAAASGEQIPYRDRSFDLVLAIGYIEYLEDPRPSLAEIRRVLRPGGRLVLQSFKPEVFGTVARTVRAPARAVYRRFVPRRGPVGVVHRPYAPRTLDRLVGEFGFVRTDFAFNNFYVMPQALRLRFPRLYIRLSEALTRRNPRGWAPLAINYIGKYRLDRR
jgi:SAM-dependent methyltransferase